MQSRLTVRGSAPVVYSVFQGSVRRSSRLVMVRAQLRWPMAGLVLWALLTAGTAYGQSRSAADQGAARPVHPAASQIATFGEETADVPAVPTSLFGQAVSRIGWLDPGRLVSLAVVLAGLVLLALSWRGSWRGEDGPQVQERCRPFSLLGALLVLYGLLLNGQWVPSGGDDAYYLAIGRSIVQSGEFAANGEPAVIVPYGWPYLIAGALAITQSFAVLNLLPLGLNVCALLLWYLVLRRVIDGRLAFAAVIATALLFHWQRCACHFYSEALYAALLAAGVLLSLQFSEGRRRVVRMVALVAICVVLVLTRLAGVMSLPLLVAALLNAPGRRGVPQWLAAALVAVALGGTFLVMRGTLARTARQRIAQVEQLATQQSGESARISSESAHLLTADAAAEGTRYVRAVRAAHWEYLRRLTNSGAWMSRLLWPPAELGKSSPFVFAVSNLAGWLLIGLLLLSIWAAVRRGEWLWLGLLGYCGAFVAVWPEPNGRYIAGPAPMLLVGLWLGMRYLAMLLKGSAWRRWWQAGSTVVVGSVVLCNLAIYAMEVWVNQSPEFNSKVLAGEYAEMTAICRYLNAQGVRDNQVAVAADKGYQLVLRATNLLTDRSVALWPHAGPPNGAMLGWARQEQVKYFICRSSNSPKRLWHVQLAPATRPWEPSSYLELYGIGETQVSRICPEDPQSADRVFDMEVAR